MWMNLFKQYNMVIFKYSLLCLPFLVFGQENNDFILPYVLEAPVKQFELAKDLDEISGLSMDANEEYLIAVQDEKGSLFYLDKETGEIINEVAFWKEGDYEGVEIVGNDIFVVKNTGTLYQINFVDQDSQTVVKYNDFLNSDNNIEGLAYWPQENKLLLACKAKPGKEMDATQKKAIYSFDLEQKQFDTIPFLVVERSIISEYLTECSPGPNHLKICSLFDGKQEKFELSPAAVAIHPIHEQLYVLSAKANLLFVLSLKGEVLHIAKLPKSSHRQPEGICFDSEGNMYISNETRKEHKANVVVYDFVAEQ